MLKLDKKNPLPFYQQLRDLLRDQIATGELKANDPIPDERAFAAQLKVSRMTVRRAIVDLTREGLFQRVRGRGTFVRPARSGKAHAPHTLTLAIAAPFGPADAAKSLFYYRILQGVQEEAERLGVTIVFRKVAAPYAAFAESLARDETLSGVIVLGIVDQRILKALAKTTLPLVLVDSSQPEGAPPLDSVSHCGGESVFAAVTHLLDLGHRDVGLINFVPSTPASLERQLAYERALRERGVPVRPEFLYPVWCEGSEAYAAMRRVLSASPIPTAVFCTSDELAIGAMEAIKDHGWSVPRDVSVVGFGDIGHFTSPELASVRVPVEEMGMKAVEFLRARVDRPAAPAQTAEFPTEFVPRASCGRPRLGGLPPGRDALQHRDTEDAKVAEKGVDG